jgi:hypothetical protein
VTDVHAGALRQYFTREDDRYHIRKAVRDRILFAVHNLLRDPPFSRIDMISCRNLLIYLNRDIQQRVLEMFHSRSSRVAILFLGSPNRPTRSTNCSSRSTRRTGSTARAVLCARWGATVAPAASADLQPAGTAPMPISAVRRQASPMPTCTSARWRALRRPAWWST